MVMRKFKTLVEESVLFRKSLVHSKWS